MGIITYTLPSFVITGVVLQPRAQVVRVETSSTRSRRRPMSHTPAEELAFAGRLVEEAVDDHDVLEGP
jgi:hypothetical protein